LCLYAFAASQSPGHAQAHVSRLGGRKIAGTLFEPLRDPALFAEARVVLGAVQWPNGGDLAPDAMYDEIRANGRWVLE
jgi:hypothetical protein